MLVITCELVNVVLVILFSVFIETVVDPVLSFVFVFVIFPTVVEAAIETGWLFGVSDEYAMEGFIELVNISFAGETLKVVEVKLDKLLVITCELV